jgi:hypothetical protein
MELPCVLEQDTPYIPTCNQTETVVESNPCCVLEKDTCISACNQTEMVVESNPYCVLEQVTHMSTCNQTGIVVGLNLATAQMTEYWLHHPGFYNGKMMSYGQDIFMYECQVWCLVNSVEQNHTMEYGIGHFIVTVLLDIAYLSFQLVLYVLCIILDSLIFLLNLFHLMCFGT